MPDGLNADFAERVFMRTSTMDWEPSPVDGVWRKRLELKGPSEAGRVTSIVKFDPGARFPEHGHPEGEEIFVLQGTFQDEEGSYPEGSFILNPDGSRHAPWSDEGCVIFVKLRQYPGTERQRVVVDTRKLGFTEEGEAGRAVIKLYEEEGYPENIRITRLGPNTRIDHHDHPGGNEMFILEGSIEDEFGKSIPGDWVRQGPASEHQPWTDEGVTLYVKDGHLGGTSGRPAHHG